MTFKTGNLINSVDNFRSILEAMPGDCVLLQANPPAYTIIVASDGFVKTVGMSRQELYDSALFDVFSINPDADDTSGETNIRSSLDHVMLHKKEHQLKLLRYDIPNSVEASLTEKYWQVSNKPVLNEAGEVTYIIHSIVDANEKVKSTQILETLKLSEQVYELFMQAPIAICILVGKEFVIELANEKILELWRKDKDVVGKTLLDGLPEINGTAFPQMLADVLETGKPSYANENHAYFTKNGEEELVYFNFVFQPYFKDEDTEASGILVVANEVTELVIARKKAEESEQRYRTLVAEAVVPTAVYTGREMKIQYANEAMLKLWKKDDTVIGKSLKEVLPELEGQSFQELLDNVYTSGETFWGQEDKAEIEVNGALQPFYFNFTYKALRNGQGEVYGILNMAMDVTDHVLSQKQLRENETNLQRLIDERTIELARKNEELEYTNEELQQFAYVASHDLQEPLRKIRMFGDFVSQQVEQDSPIRKYVGKITSSADRMTGLINNLLDYSKLSMGAIRYERVDLNTIIKNVLSDYELLISQKNALINVDTFSVIKAVPLQMNQLFYNLLGNALKFTKRNVQPIITITQANINEDQKHEWGLDPHKDYIRIEISDNGLGFEQDYANKIFTIFQQLNEKSQYGGYGIGLALCKKVVDVHKGRISAEGRLKEGATFKVILPVK